MVIMSEFFFLMIRKIIWNKLIYLLIFFLVWIVGLEGLFRVVMCDFGGCGIYLL